MKTDERLPRLAQLREDSCGWGVFLCARKDVRSGRNGEFITLTLEDNSAQVTARIFDDVERLRDEFGAGEFVKVQGRANLFNGRLQFIVERIRRVHAEQDRSAGFSESDCVPASV